MCSHWGCRGWWTAGAGLGVGLMETAVEGSRVLGSVWLALVAVCGGRMVGRFVMEMSTRVWVGSCCVAASVVAVRAGGRGARDAVGVGFFLAGAFLLLLLSPLQWLKEEVKAAYKKMVLKLHPEKNKNNQEKQRSCSSR